VEKHRKTLLSDKTSGNLLTTDTQTCVIYCLTIKKFGVIIIDLTSDYKLGSINTDHIGEIGIAIEGEIDNTKAVLVFSLRCLLLSEAGKPHYLINHLNAAQSNPEVHDTSKKCNM
jgi:hypothetical protein